MRQTQVATRWLECQNCGASIGSFMDWQSTRQVCPGCESGFVHYQYARDYEDLVYLIRRSTDPLGPWRYRDFMPVEHLGNIVSSGEGNVAIERWRWLEEIARDYSIDCEVFAHRHDNNPSTGTFKDLAGSVVASVLKESGITQYVVASTGNIGVALGRYLGAAGIALYVFIPRDASPLHDAELGCFGQKVFRVDGDYATAKALAKEFATHYGLCLSPGQYDPIRIEAKRTMLFDWVSRLDAVPTVYVQALSGGMGPLGIYKGCQELAGTSLRARPPRFYLIQTDACCPMADAWTAAKANGFPPGWERSYPVVHNPPTRIATLATGNPGLFPQVGRIVRETGGEILTFPESRALDIARLVAIKSAVRIGPAAAIAVGGFLRALKSGAVVSGDRVIVAIGEGIRRSPDFLTGMKWSSEVRTLSECSLYDRRAHEERLVAAALADL
jgi:threonine synthase